MSIFYDCSPRNIDFSGVTLSRRSQAAPSISPSPLTTFYYPAGESAPDSASHEVYDELLGPVRLLDKSYSDNEDEPLPPRLFLTDRSVFDSLLKRLAVANPQERPMLIGFSIDFGPLNPDTLSRLSGMGISVIDGLELSQTSPGDYFLVALPMVSPVGEAVPLRVVLKDVL